MATSTITVKTGGEWVKFDTLGYTFENGKEYTLQVLGSAKFGDDGKNGILIDGSEPYTFTKKSGVDLYVLTNDSAVVTVSDTLTLGLATKGGSGGGGSGGEAVWGGITGTLSDQTDLTDALSAKQDTLVSGTNIKTINNESLLGSGNITISGSVPNQNTAVGATNPLEFWEGTSAEYNNGGTVTFYNWQRGGAQEIATNIDIAPNNGIYADGKYVIVGDSGKIATSTDGINWTLQTSGVSENLYGIIYDGTQFVVTGNNSTIITSTDTETWTAINSGISANFGEIAYGNGLYVIAKNGTYANNIYYSSDLSTWNTVSQKAYFGTIFFYNNNFYTSDIDGYDIMGIYKSSDAVNWSSRINTNALAEVLSAAGSYMYARDKYSTDNGTNWSKNTGYSSISVYKAVYGNNKYACTNYLSGANEFLLSDDGLGWTKIASTTQARPRVIYGNGIFICLDRNSSGFKPILYSGAPVSVYTTDQNPTTESVVYDNTTTQSALTITAVGTGTITLSDTNTYTYNSAGNQTVTQTVGQAHPDWLCFIEGVGIKMGNVSFIPTVDQTYDATSANAQSGVAVASGISDTLGTINTQLESIIAQGD